MSNEIHNRLYKVRQRIAAAAYRVGRNPEDITLIAVTKTVDTEAIWNIYKLGIRDVGENRVQEFRAKYAKVPAALRWHFIGHLQRNKVKHLVGRIFLLHSLDRMSLAEEISRRAMKQQAVVRSLVQVNVSGETTKSGLAPDEVPSFCKEVAGLPGLQVEGLMTIAPYGPSEQARPVFRELKELARKVDDEAGVTMRYLSMGMSNDFEVAVEEGANILRIGTAIFGPRKSKEGL
ncbi:MAG: YggS family pyridoxal phosphate-dependent enzyme [Peptococcaceae bacterium]|nr:YggS family pyridoxal phosphate-dependent enzyme [Peptococcaceae bacterium]